MRKGQRFETFFFSPSELDIMITLNGAERGGGGGGGGGGKGKGGG